MMAELLLGSPLFPGESGVDQLVEIIKVGGTAGWEMRAGAAAACAEPDGLVCPACELLAIP